MELLIGLAIMWALAFGLPPLAVRLADWWRSMRASDERRR